MAATLEDCLTCWRKTDDFHRMADEDIGETVASHFWFKADQYEDRVLCTGCWGKIDDFHKFYCEVKQLWKPDNLAVGAVIKKEDLPNEEEPHHQEILACEVLKVEVETKSDDESFGDDEDRDEDFKVQDASDQTEDSEEESTVPIAKRSRKVKGKRKASKGEKPPPRKKRQVASGPAKRLTVTPEEIAERDELIRKFCALKCDKCDFTGANFYFLEKHYTTEHNLLGYATCCNKKFFKKRMLYEHCQRHVDPDIFRCELCQKNFVQKDTLEQHKARVHSSQSSKPVPKRLTRAKGETAFRCELCDPVRMFQDEQGLHLHTAVSHPDETEKKFPCDLCEKAFASEWQLSSHKNWHQKELLNISCDKCGIHFDSARTLNNHIKAHHTKNLTDLSPATFGSITDTATNDPPSTTGSTEDAASSPQVASVSAKKKHLKSSEEIAERDELIKKFCALICDQCGFKGANFYFLEKHYATEHNLLGYATCCNKKFFKKRKLYEHCQQHVDPDIWRCELCQKNFAQKDTLELHKTRVHLPDSEKPFKCDICNAAFYKEYLLKGHMKYHVSKELKVFNCQDCDKTFGAASYLRAHQQGVHGAVSSWVCDICAKGFPLKSALERHRLTHSEEGAASLKIKCEHCNRWSKNANTYKAHIGRCLAVTNRVKCNLCGKEVAHELALASHKREYHSDQERPMLTCSFCGKQFKRAIRHKEHEANHRGEVLYTCPFCPYSCNSNSNMYTHKNTVHQELWAAKIAEKYYKR